MSLVYVYLALMVCLIPFCKSDQDTLNNEFCALAMSVTDMCTANGYVSNLKPDITHHPSTIEPDTTQQAPSPCPIGFEEVYRGTIMLCLKLIYLSNYGTTWSAARDYCLGIDADLVSIQSQLEQYAVQDFIDSSGVSIYHHWIGLNDQVSEGVYVWANGTATSYTHWGGNRPGGVDGDDCVVMRNRSEDFGWSDYLCSARFLTFICEI